MSQVPYALIAERKTSLKSEDFDIIEGKSWKEWGKSVQRLRTKMSTLAKKQQYHKAKNIKI